MSVIVVILIVLIVILLVLLAINHSYYFHKNMMTLSILKRHRRHKKISLLVPFHADHAERTNDWEWLRKYWRHHLPEAEIIIMDNDEQPFCKTAAVNDAFRRSMGDIIVILDADCYIKAETIRHCANEIRRARCRGHRLWFIPYRRFYRITESATQELLNSDWCDPVMFGDPPEDWQYDPNRDHSSGHWWGALIQIMPREAFEMVGGMDERFKGWGGEDIAFMHLLDTLYARHRIVNGPVFHLWHQTIKGTYLHTKQWLDQDMLEPNDVLSGRYEAALGDKRLMKRLKHLDNKRNDTYSRNTDEEY